MFLHDAKTDDTAATNNDNVKAIPIPRVFSENNQAKNIT